MSELVSYRAPYSDMRFDGDGRQVASWASIVQMTIKAGLRPTLPLYADGEIRSLIVDCWDENPDLRPSAVRSRPRFTSRCRGSKHSQKRFLRLIFCRRSWSIASTASRPR